MKAEREFTITTGKLMILKRERERAVYANRDLGNTSASVVSTCHLYILQV